MKLLIFLLALGIIGIYAINDSIQQIQEYRKECREEYNAEKDALIRAIKTKNYPTDITKCYFACMLKKTGVMNEDNSLNEEGLRARLENNFKVNVDRFISNCMSINELQQNGDDECSIGVEFMKCFHKQETSD